MNNNTITFTFNQNIAQTKMVRHLVMEQYIANHSNAKQCNTDTISVALDSEITNILNELKECLLTPYNSSTPFSGVNADENVIPLQVCNIIDSFSRTLSEQDCNIFVRRYFFAESINNISVRYKLSEKRINTALEECRSSFKIFLATRHYVMKADTLLNGFTDIDANLITRSEYPTSKTTKSWLIPVSIIACLLLLIGISIPLIIIALDDGEETQTDEIPDSFNIIGGMIYEDPIYDDPMYEITMEPTYIKNGRVDIDKLLEIFAYETDDISDTLIITSPYAPQYTMYYTDCAQIDDNEILAECIGYQNYHMGQTDDSVTYHYLKGHTSSEYLISVEEEEYRLWKYDHMEITPDSENDYSYLLSWRYGISSADIISYISITYAVTETADGEPIYDKANVEKISSVSSELSYIYYMFAHMSCVTTPWDSLTDTDYTFEEIQESALKIEITTIDDYMVNNLYYSPLDGRFYEEGGYAFEKLDENTVTTLNELFNIDI